MQHSSLALQLWVLANLDITNKCLSIEQARRWQRLKMKNFEEFCKLALFGFIERRRRDGTPNSWPEQEFGDFIGEFTCKLDHVLRKRSSNIAVPMFDRVGPSCVSGRKQKRPRSASM